MTTSSSHYVPPSSRTTKSSWLEIFEALDPSWPASWSQLAADLRSEADLHTGDQRIKRLDRALECEHRAARQRMRKLQWIPTITTEDAKALYASVEAEVAP